MPYAGQVDKTMGADTVGHLKHLLETELKRAREENNLDIYKAGPWNAGLESFPPKAGT